VITVVLQCQTVQGAYQLEYVIEVRVDGSAYWIIEQRGIGIQPSFETFCQKVNSLLEEAKEKTSKNMAAKDLSMTANLSGSYSIIKYMFLWENFSVVEGSCIKIGDVFEIVNFFEYLYGNGIVRIEYPSEYNVESVSPTPHAQDPSIPMLEWYGTEDFKIGEPKITLREKSSSTGLFDTIVKNWILTIILAVVLITGGSVGLYCFKFQRKIKKHMEQKGVEGQISLGIENDEEKVIGLLRAAGGIMYQSTIADRCGFSRAKTSKLLKDMENKGKIKREHKGRERVVTLLEEKGERE
jgi:uncharacterized membrane protein